MAGTEPPSGGIINALRRMAHSMGSLAQARFELFIVELQEEKLRTISLLIWVGAGCALGLAGVLVGIAALGLFMWERAGYAGLIGLALCTLAGAGAIFAHVRHRIIKGPQPFASTSEEFRKDVASLKPPE